MAKRHKETARKKRSILMELLGGKCRLEHTGKCAGGLTFDCIESRGDNHHKGSTDQRMNFYWREHFIKKNIQILCHYHNSKKGRLEGLRQNKKEENEPF
jgi:hypothetical protein